VSETQVRVRLPEDLAERFLALPPGDRAAVVARGFGVVVPLVMTPALTRGEVEALDTAIAMFQRGAAGGGAVGFRAEQEYLHEYSDLAEDLSGLRAKFGGTA
jgi:hypothetical protein